MTSNIPVNNTRSQKHADYFFNCEKRTYFPIIMRGKNWVNLMKNALTKVKTTCTCVTAAISVTLVAHRCNYLCDLRCLHAGVSYRTKMLHSTHQKTQPLGTMAALGIIHCKCQFFSVIERVNYQPDLHILESLYI